MPEMLTASELEQLRSDVLDLLPDTCQIQRPADTRSGAYVVPGWGTAVVSVACRFDPETLRREQDVLADRETLANRYMVSLPYDTDVQAGDRIVFSSNVYQIIQIHTEHSLRAVKRVRVSLIEGD